MCNLISNPKESKDNTHVWEQSAKHSFGSMVEKMREG